MGMLAGMALARALFAWFLKPELFCAGAAELRELHADQSFDNQIVNFK